MTFTADTAARHAIPLDERIKKANENSRWLREVDAERKAADAAEAAAEAAPRKAPAITLRSRPIAATLAEAQAVVAHLEAELAARDMQLAAATGLLKDMGADLARAHADLERHQIDAVIARARSSGRLPGGPEGPAHQFLRDLGRARGAAAAAEYVEAMPRVSPVGQPMQFRPTELKRTPGGLSPEAFATAKTGLTDADFEKYGPKESVR